MSNREKPFDHDDPLHAVAGVLAGSVAGQLSQPLRELRESLSGMIETLDSYVSEAEGPIPYPWKSLQVLRQNLSAAYLLSRQTTRLASELFDAVTMSGGVVSPVDVNKVVDATLSLMRHRIHESTEVFVDLGSIPLVSAVSGELMLVIAKMLICCADSAALREHSAISVKTRCEQDSGVDEVAIYIADNGAGFADAVESARRVLRPVLGRLSGSFDAVAEPDQGTAFECRLPVLPAPGDVDGAPLEAPRDPEDSAG